MKISICIPVLNEELSLESFYKEIATVAKELPSYEFEFVFSDNNSNDKSWETLTELGRHDSRIKAIQFSRNIGFDQSILFNYSTATGDAFIQIDCDLQDDPAVIKNFVNEWELGAKVVYGLRNERNENFIVKILRNLGYEIIRILSESKITPRVGNFCLIDREVRDILMLRKSQISYLRGAIFELNFQSVKIPYTRRKRVSGESKFNFFKVVGLGIDAIINHSLKPLRLATIIGLFFLFLSFISIIYYIGLKFFDTDLPRGLASIHILILINIAFNSMFLGIIGEYLLRLVKNLRPLPSPRIVKVINLDYLKNGDI